MASKPEQLMWDHLKAKMEGRWDAQRHEDEYSPDVPDVSYALRGRDGWIELKTIAEWPKRGTTAVNLDRLRPGQVNWLESRGRHGNGRCWLLLAVGTNMGSATWVLIPYHRIREVYDRTMTAEDLLHNFPYAHGPGLVQMLLLQL